MSKKPKKEFWEDAPMKASDFIARTPVFRSEEFVNAHTADGRSRATSAAILRYHVKQGHLFNQRRGLYTTTGPVDPWVLGSRLTRDAVIAYDGALSFYKLAPLGYRISFVGEARFSHFSFNEVVYSAVRTKNLPRSTDIETHERAGQQLKVTSLECTFVDLLDRLDLAPEPLALFKTFQKVWPRLDQKLMTERAYAVNALAASRVALFLSGVSGVTTRTLRAFDALRPKSTGTFNRATEPRGGEYVSRWNLMVPQDLLRAITRFDSK